MYLGGTGPWCSSSSQLARLRCTTSLSFCAIRAVGAREGAVPGSLGGLPVVWSSNALGLLSHLQSFCAKLSSGPALHPQQRLELAPMCWREETHGARVRAQEQKCHPAI